MEELEEAKVEYLSHYLSQGTASFARFLAYYFLFKVLLLLIYLLLASPRSIYLQRQALKAFFEVNSSQIKMDQKPKLQCHISKPLLYHHVDLCLQILMVFLLLVVSELALRPDWFAWQNFFMNFFLVRFLLAHSYL